MNARGRGPMAVRPDLTRSESRNCSGDRDERRSARRLGPGGNMIRSIGTELVCSPVGEHVEVRGSRWLWICQLRSSDRSAAALTASGAADDRLVRIAQRIAMAVMLR